MPRGKKGELEDRILGLFQAEFDRRSWSYQELSRRTGVDYNTLYKVMTGERALSLKYVEVLARALDISLSDVFAPAEHAPSLSALRQSIGHISGQWMEWLSQLDQSPAAQMPEPAGGGAPQAPIKEQAQAMVQAARQEIARVRARRGVAGTTTDATAPAEPDAARSQPPSTAGRRPGSPRKSG